MVKLERIGGDKNLRVAKSKKLWFPLPVAK
jgi:hypothetical protein